MTRSEGAPPCQPESEPNRIAHGDRRAISDCMPPSPSADDLFVQANRLLAQGRAAEALALYEQLERDEPNHPGTLANIGVAQAEIGRHAEAIASYDAALGLKPDFAEAHYNRGNSLKEL